MRPIAGSRRSRPLVVVAVLALTLAAMVSSNAATPGSGSVGPGAPTTSWSGPVQTAVTNGPADADCQAANAYCDDYTLTVTVPAGFYSTHSGGVTISLSTQVPANDFDLYVYSNPQHTTEVDH